LKARVLTNLNRVLTSTRLYGASPPGVFIGQYGYPKVSAGPLIPPVFGEDTSIMDAPERWLDKSFGDLLNYRLSLLRGHSKYSVTAARAPDKMLSSVQEVVMAARPTDTELWFKKPPRLRVLISPREAPIGPTGQITKVIVAENPTVPRTVDHVVSDRDLKAELAVDRLYSSSISQQQITRMFSIGLLGVQRDRRLVPTEWSITAVDDILGKQLRREILQHQQISEYMVFGYKALANNVQVLLLPSAWMYEAMEAWLMTSNPYPAEDYELTQGRKDYPSNVVGAYHAARLPILEYLQKIRRQAGAIAFLEVEREWIPLGVWRFREICRAAMNQSPRKCTSLQESLEAVSKRLKLPMRNWLAKSALLKHYKSQLKLDAFLRS
jgi:hypothetical protein